MRTSIECDNHRHSGLVKYFRCAKDGGEMAKKNLKQILHRPVLEHRVRIHLPELGVLGFQRL